MRAEVAAGFADPVMGAQAAFRAIMGAMARPARPVTLPVAAPSEELGAGMAAVALTLLDHETPVWLDAATRPVAAWLRFHCGAPIAASPGDAAFALIGAPATMPRLASFAAGEEEYPDRSATLVIAVAGLAGGEGPAFRGPGIDGAARLTIAGLPPWFWEDWRANHAAYPLGVDCLFTCGDRLAGLPRSIAMEG